MLSLPAAGRDQHGGTRDRHVSGEATLGGAVLFGEPVTPMMIAGIAVVALGVAILAAAQGQH
ncbi:hypothetical protein OPKNFCMD_0195 [Methylobacterium crusticola]|uniref:EamA domain-containing protein n=1 Tax=Methylobacterium crusticola TaxID=1697972 RepID=A0ABQ4QQD5_9HYPH|nr:hypothetical protein [Methylobacterium crusticola]GJD47487.1 hypothetical protein OPKNFCMD_0195 [Methylobacterium crusticola]